MAAAATDIGICCIGTVLFTAILSPLIQLQIAHDVATAPLDRPYSLRPSAEALNGIDSSAWSTYGFYCFLMFALAYHVFLEIRYRTTLGKRVFGLELLSVGPSGMSRTGAALRIGIKLVCNPCVVAIMTSSNFSPLVRAMSIMGLEPWRSNALAYAVGFLVGLVLLIVNSLFLLKSPQHVAVHDLVVRTLVVAKEAALRREYISNIAHVGGMPK